MHTHDDDPRTSGSLVHIVIRDADAPAAIGFGSDRVMKRRDTRAPSSPFPTRFGGPTRWIIQLHAGPNLPSVRFREGLSMRVSRVSRLVRFGA
jgi:hypothetical protein